ncbi:yippee-domain-containing protein [Sodiomyces alkalinus F11]|uniref:Protein yippee-like n=1 Tax=Sodiomyces alkalinus (strain CBS 110278 / VKM F-3762 / F11) TaxID=1314773 RepID=A0A3N2PWZ9_SODAK|nr:yippee-domain-containing protein [Sodiomyces alkalinus F11]ROT38865.1 yippee-domain-containing protein [Sodiomyces alkalinus F11]
MADLGSIIVNSSAISGFRRRLPALSKYWPAALILTGSEQPFRLAHIFELGVMGLAYNTYLDSAKIYGCKTCKAHLANHEDIVSRNFRGQHGKAYLFNSVVNIDTGEPSERNMTTGRHVVRDITCRQCKETVGWKYDKAYEATEKYKEGKFILEAELLCNVT